MPGMRLALLPLLLAAAACADAGKPSRLSTMLRRDIPDQVPALLDSVLPFRYPAELYLRRVQGNVTLRLFVDREGRIVGDSTRVEETSGFASLDSAAVRGAESLHFSPARRGREAMGVSILFPVYFRHPEAPPLPGDTILQKRP